MAKDAKPAEAQAPAGGGNKKMMMIIIGVVALVLIGGAAAGYMFFMGGGEGGGDHAAAPAKGEKKKEKSEKALYTTIDAFVVNIRGADDENHYLQLAFDMKVDGPTTQEEIKQKMPEIRNKVLVHLSSKRVEDLIGPEGKQKLSEELKNQVNELMGYKDHSVSDVLFTSFVIQ